MQDSLKSKYLKYKKKYLDLKMLKTGGSQENLSLEAFIEKYGGSMAGDTSSGASDVDEMDILLEKRKTDKNGVCVIGLFDHPEECDDALAIFGWIASLLTGKIDQLIILYGGKATGNKWTSRSKQDNGVPNLVSELMAKLSDEKKEILDNRDKFNCINININIVKNNLENDLSQYVDHTKNTFFVICGPYQETKYNLKYKKTNSLFKRFGFLPDYLVIQAEQFNVPEKGNVDEVEYFKDYLPKNVLSPPGGYEEATGLKLHLKKSTITDSDKFMTFLKNNPNAFKSALGFWTRLNTTSPPNNFLGWKNVSVVRNIPKKDTFMKLISGDSNLVEVFKTNKIGETSNHPTAAYTAYSLGCRYAFNSVDPKYKNLPKASQSEYSWTSAYNETSNDINKEIDNSILELGHVLISTSVEFESWNLNKLPKEITNFSDHSSSGILSSEELEAYKWLCARAGILWFWRSYTACCATEQFTKSSSTPKADLCIAAKDCIDEFAKKLKDLWNSKYKGEHIKDLPFMFKELPWPGMFYDDGDGGMFKELPWPGMFYDDGDGGMFKDGIPTSFKKKVVDASKDMNILTSKDKFLYSPEFLSQKFANNEIKLNPLLPHCGDVSVCLMTLDLIEVLKINGDVTEKIKAIKEQIQKGDVETYTNQISFDRYCNLLKNIGL